MRRRRHRPAEELRRALREWDPAVADAQLTAEETRQLERLLAGSASQVEPIRTRRLWPQLALATSGALAAVLVLLAGWGWRATEVARASDPPTSDRAAAATPAPPNGDRATPRPRTVQVQLIARGGTRIVWVLNPELPAFPGNSEEDSHAK